MAELEKFDESLDQMELTKAVVDVAEENQDGSRFAHGDFVEVCEGELIHLKGKVLRVDGKKVVIQPEHEALKDPIEFPSRTYFSNVTFNSPIFCFHEILNYFSAGELKKYFKLGDHVRVLRGHHEGSTGMVIRVEDNRVVLVSDLGNHELKVLPEDIQLSAERATGIDSLGQYQWGDLVELDAQTVGVIVRY